MSAPAGPGVSRRVPAGSGWVRFDDVRHRFALRAAAVLTGLVLPLLLAAPALALDDGEVPGHQSALYLVLVLAVAPIGGFLVIASLALLPTMLGRPRYRPGRPWEYDALWFGGPEDPDRALTAARPGTTARGGASARW